MEYAVGKTGRVVAARLMEGDELYESIESIAKKEDIRAGAVLITGGFRKADVVVGPSQEAPKLEPIFTQFTGPGETMGVGTIYVDNEGEPKLHLHAGMCRDKQMVIGCPRGGAEVFLILEVTIIEITGINAARVLDEKMGVKLLKIEGNQGTCE